MFDTQVRSFFFVANAFLSKIVCCKQGKIVAVLSYAVYWVIPQGQSNYVAVKYALLGMVKALAVEYASKAVQINAVSPSMMETKFLQNISEIVIGKNAMEPPLKRNVTVDDITPAILFLLSNGSDFITRQNYLISGGLPI